MIPYILGGVALAVTGLGVKKYLEDEDNCKKLEDTVCDWIDKAEETTDVFFDYANKKIDEFDKKRNESNDNSDDDFNDEHDETKNESCSTSLLLPPIVMKPITNHIKAQDKVIKNEVFVEFEKALSNLNNKSLKDLKIAFSEINNLPRTFNVKNYVLNENKYNFIKPNDEIIKSFNKYIKIINEVGNYIENQLDVIDTIIISSDNFLTYGQEDQKIIENLMNVCDTINKVNYIEIILDGENISREVKRAFAKLEGLII